jgi:hypothetical protein
VIVCSCDQSGPAALAAVARWREADCIGLDQTTDELAEMETLRGDGDLAEMLAEMGKADRMAAATADATGAMAAATADATAAIIGSTGAVVGSTGAVVGPSGALLGVCDAQSLFMMGHELRTCMRIDVQCVRENAALLGVLAQGCVRVLSVYDDELDLAGGSASSSVGSGEDSAESRRSSAKDGDEGSRPDAHHGARRRTACRTVARLLGAEGTGEPILFLDQPIFGHHLSAGDAAQDAATRAALGARLIQRGRRLARQLGVRLAPWTVCIAPPSDGAEMGTASATDGADAAARIGRVALLELDGVAPQVYSNLRGRLIRGSDRARGRAPNGQGPPSSLVQSAAPQGAERIVLHALASLEGMAAVASGL